MYGSEIEFEHRLHIAKHSFSTLPCLFGVFHDSDSVHLLANISNPIFLISFRLKFYWYVHNVVHTPWLGQRVIPPLIMLSVCLLWLRPIVGNSHTDKSVVNEVPLWDDGTTLHKLCIIISAVLTVVSFLLAMIIVMGHALHYSHPGQQR